MDLEDYRVLVVDDDEFVRLNLVVFLEDEGFEVLSASNGEEALEILKHKTVDVAVVDMRLPGMDGNAFILKANDIKPGIRFIIHTGSINYSIPDPLKNMGIKSEQVFLKPVAEMGLISEAIIAVLKDNNTSRGS